MSAFTFRTEGLPSPSHETLRVFVNGASAGLVTLRTDEALAFKRALSADAAAPDLLDALRCIAMGAPGVRAGTANADDLRRIASAAIAKATP